MAATTEIKAEKAKALSKPSKHLFMILLPLPFLVGIGIVGNQQGWIGGPKQEVNKEVGLDLAIPDAKVKELKKDQKYDAAASLPGDMQPVSGLGITLDDNANINSRMMAGDNNNVSGLEPNTKSDVENFAKSIGAENKGAGTLSSEDMKLTSQQRKNKVRQSSIAQQKAYNRDVNRTVNNMYNNPAAEREERAEKARAIREEEQRLKANDKLLAMLDKQMNQQNQPVQRPMNVSQNAVPRNYSTGRNKGQNTQSSDEYSVEVNTSSIGTNGREGGNGFYGLNGSKVKNNRPSKVKGSIRAVVHGDGDGITVTNGSSVSIRMQDETKIMIEGEPLILPQNTLVYGIARITGDRIDISVSTIRVNNFIYNVSLVAYDLDGRKGLYVPDMRIKQQVNNSLAQSSTQMMSPSYVMGGSVAQQVGGQLASQGVNMVMQTGRNVLQRKMQQPKAQVRPNYQILLRAGKNNEESETEEETDSEIIE
ncbi:conjugative transposon protein TraM [Dyadobacter flavalbus]|uniref:Conjugative transposon protein TraM n=1 Tax=Dyadobacter flavalbus TaxID=2579942 RepID=A0A5M8QYY6_9BACT|nr:conjugative transposon protein TraM [Dyadobacter flavalbus]KAA6439914.1 conjugative transposon protein TraM [Dyadobacter flavalbus]